MNDGEVVFQITGDSGPIDRVLHQVTNNIQEQSRQWDQAGDHAQSSVQDITGTVRRESQEWADAAQDSGGKIENSFTKAIKNIGAAFAASKIGQAIIDYGKQAISAASDLAEVQNVVDVTFGDAAGRIETWAKKAGAQFGLTETQAKRFTSTMGAMVKSAGLAGPEIVEMSTSLAGLAADMASFYNLDFETAFEKIRSGISGETEPLKQLGVNMSVANLEAFALQQGLEKTFSKMSQGEQVMLRYQYLMQATADAQGDFARTSDGFANAGRRVESALESLKTKIGGFLLTAVEPLIVRAADAAEALTFESDGTILDEFATINLHTQEKIGDIQRVAQEAKDLVGILETLQSKNISPAVEKISADLNSINVDQDKLGIVNSTLSVLQQNASAIMDITGEDADGFHDFLAKVASDAEELAPDDTEGWKAISELLANGVPGLEDTEGGQSILKALSGDFSEMGREGSRAAGYLEALGIKTDDIADKNALWLETCQRLIQTIPGLSSIINAETGEVNGGIQAVKDYIKAWEDGQTKLAMMGAYGQKETALAERFADLPGLQLDAAVARRRAQRARDALNEFNASLPKGFLDQFYDENNVPSPQDSALAQQLRELSDAYTAASEEAARAEKAYRTQADAMDEAKAALQEYKETIDEMPDGIQEATDAVMAWSGHTETEVQGIVQSAKAALDELSAYAKSVRDAVAASVDSTVSGFQSITSPAQAIAEKIDDLTERYQAGKIKAEEYEQQLAALNAQKIDTGSMEKGLVSQLAFMDHYIANLEKARTMGLSDELIAALSDGSAESADYLEALVNDTTGAAQRIDAGFKAVNERKQQFTDELAKNQLAIDEQYTALQEKAAEAVASLDMSGEAAQNTAATMESIVAEISGHVPSVAAAVDSILAELARLSDFGFNLSIDPMGGIVLDGSHETGLDYVPFNGYLAELHAGEGILTAEENRLWQRFKAGGNSTRNVDYDMLGGVMRDNVHAGGNVYLDGRTVGRVIGEAQGESYRTLKRSGWQA